MKVRMNTIGINYLKDNIAKSLIAAGEAVKTELAMSQTMPFDTGTMQNDSTFVETKRAIQGVVQIVVDTPYARKVYFDPEVNIHTDKNPNAKQYYFDDFTKGSKKELPIRVFAREMKRREG